MRRDHGSCSAEVSVSRRIPLRLFRMPYTRRSINDSRIIQHQKPQRRAEDAHLCATRFSRTVVSASNPGVFIGGQQHPVDFEPARRFYGALDAARVVMYA